MFYTFTYTVVHVYEVWFMAKRKGWHLKKFQILNIDIYKFWHEIVPFWHFFNKITDYFRTNLTKLNIFFSRVWRNFVNFWVFSIFWECLVTNLEITQTMIRGWTGVNSCWLIKFVRNKCRLKECSSSRKNRKKSATYT